MQLMLKNLTSTLRFRLLFALGTIIIFCQIGSMCWLWHESKEQVGLMVQAIIDNKNNVRHIHKEMRDAVFSLVIPSTVLVILTLTLCYQAVKWIIRPLFELKNSLEHRSEDNLEPLCYKDSVSEINAVAIAINQLIYRLKISLERERLFTADVAHELRTPLAGLKLHLELLQSKHDAEVMPLVHRLDHMSDSVTQLLHLARVGHSFSTGNYHTFSLQHDVITPLHFEITEMLSEHRQNLAMNINEVSTLRGDATLIRVLLRNLIENASRYSPRDSTITISVKCHSSIELTVEDEGPGIDDNKSGELTKAFKRMDSRYGGIGLGLSIVTRIAQLHNAQFIIENRKECSGCRASIRF